MINVSTHMYESTKCSSVVEYVFRLTDAIFLENPKKIRAISKQHLLLVRFVRHRDCIVYFKQQVDHILVSYVTFLGSYTEVYLYSKV